LFFKSLHWCFHEGTHESKFYSVLFGKLLLHCISCIHEVSHINLVEGCKQSIRVLGFLQSAGDCWAHFAHLNANLSSRSLNFSWSFLRLGACNCGLLLRSSLSGSWMRFLFGF
jgi:hypothetical protein